MKMIPSVIDIETAKKEIEEHGFSLIRDLPEFSDDEYVSLGRYFGCPIKQYYNSDVVWKVKPKQEFDEIYHSQNRSMLKPHTECYEFEGLPPKY